MSEIEITWKELAVFIESEEIGFDMDHWNDITSCGTVACIGGSYEFLYEKKFGESVSGLQLNNISREEHDILCFPTSPDRVNGNWFYFAAVNDDDYITREHAVRVLRDIQNGGTIDRSIWERNK